MFFNLLTSSVTISASVIDDALCEKRLWDMKFRGMKNFYMCEVRKDFTIDATFKGNASRFLNHSCDPNCFLEKWLVWSISLHDSIAVLSFLGKEFLKVLFIIYVSIKKFPPYFCQIKQFSWLKCFRFNFTWSINWEVHTNLYRMLYDASSVPLVI